MEKLNLSPAQTALVAIDLQNMVVSVESTARAAFELGYEQIFAQDAMASLSAAQHEHSVTYIFPRMGRVRNTAEVLAAI